MRRILGRLGMVAALGLLATAAGADEEKIPLGEVPAAVIKAVKAKFAGAQLKGAEKEDEDGKTVYEINLVHEGQKIEVSLTPDGKIVAIEREIGAKDLPAAVADALRAKYPGATKRKVEVIEEDGKTSYETLLQTADKKLIEVKTDPAGKVLETEEKKAHDKD